MLEVVKCSNKSSGQALSLEDNLLKKVSRWMTTEELQEGQLLLRMVLSTLDNGLTASEMDLDHKCGQSYNNYWLHYIITTEECMNLFWLISGLKISNLPV